MYFSAAAFKAGNVQHNPYSVGGMGKGTAIPPPPVLHGMYEGYHAPTSQGQDHVGTHVSAWDGQTHRRVNPYYYRARHARGRWYFVIMLKFRGLDIKDNLKIWFV